MTLGTELESPSRNRRRRSLATFGPAAPALGLAATIVWAASLPGLPLWSLGLMLLEGVAVLLMLGLSSMIAFRRPAMITSLVVLAVAVVVSITGVAAQARFALSVGAFESLVAEAGPPTSTADKYGFDPLPVPCPSHIGLYPVDECRSFSGGYLFMQPGNQLSDDSGVAYVTSAPAAGRFSGWRHLSGRWYVWQLEPVF